MKVNNPYVYGMYLLHKEEMQNYGTVVEKLLYHCTSPSNAHQIARNNIDWRLTSRTRFGKGACFSDSPTYAHKYSGSNGGKTNDLIFLLLIINLCTILAMVMCKVLTRAVQDMFSTNYNLEVPDVYYDTTLGNNGSVTVKYDDYTFYPKYIIYYSMNSRV